MADCGDQDRSDVKVKESDCTIENDDDDYTSNESDLGEERDNKSQACCKNDDGGDSGSDTDHPARIHANNYFKPHCNFGSQYGDVHDEEMLPVESPTSSIDSWEEMGKVESSSKELYSSETAYMYGVNFNSKRPTAVTAGLQFDEEYAVPSSPVSSLVSSPKKGAYNTRSGSLQGYLHSMGGHSSKYSRYSTNPPTETYVDDKLRSSLLQTLADNDLEFDLEQFMSKPRDYTDGEPILTDLDNTPYTRGSYTASADYALRIDTFRSASGPSSTHEPGYDSREYGERDSLEHQRSERESLSTRSHLVDGADDESCQCDTCISESPGESSEYYARKERKDKKMKKEKELLTHQVEGYVGDKNLDEVLKFLGEDDAVSTDKSKKKKDKKKKDVNKTEKRKTKDSGGSSSHQSKKKESQVSQKKETNTSKVKLGAKKDHNNRRT